MEISAAGHSRRTNHAVARYEQRIEESIYLILSTAKGERVMQPDFGCGIHDLVFAPNNAMTLAMVAKTVREALTSLEPRIDVLEVSPEAPPEEPNLLLIRINYRIRPTMSSAISFIRSISEKEHNLCPSQVWCL